jgi:N-acetyl sugar amidotransferase
VPGSGGKDSVYAAHMLKFKYGMHPLTVTWAPQMYTDWGWRNMQAWIHGGFDNELFTPNGKAQRLLTRLATETMFHPFQPFVLGQKTIAVKTAIRYGIPLIFYGDHASDWGVALADADQPDINYSYYAGRPEEEVFIGGVSLADLKGRLGLTDNDLFPYMQVDPQEIERINPVVHYLGYYLKWHPQGNYYFASEHGFEPSPERTPGTYSKYASIDDKVDDFNFWCYFVKFGVGRATTDASQEVRAQDINLDEAKALIRRYDGEFPERFAEDFFAHISLPREEFPAAADQFEQPIMDRDYFMHLADRFRSPHVWKRENQSWQLRHVVWKDQEESVGASDIDPRQGPNESVRAG